MDFVSIINFLIIISFQKTSTYGFLEPTKYLYPINSNITDEQACLIEPMGVAHNIIERIDVKGKDCLVIGCGPVGLFAVACAKGISIKVSRIS